VRRRYGETYVNTMTTPSANHHSQTRSALIEPLTPWPSPRPRGVSTLISRSALGETLPHGRWPSRGLLARDPAPLTEALQYYERAAHPLELARTHEDLAAIAAARGDSVTARGHLNRAVDAYAALGAEGEIARADTRLRALGVRRGRRRTAARPDGGWAALTPTEVKVAGLVAKGRSNREIAATLSLSPRTVQTHVSHILAKLGADSRTQIAREAATRLPAVALPSATAARTRIPIRSGSIRAAHQRRV
jgi:DNA-binding CsgD family transcriptional regulator